MYRKPHLFFAASVDSESAARLKTAARSKGATIATSEVPGPGVNQSQSISHE